MATAGPLTEVSEAVGTAWKVYELGWVHDHSSSQHFVEFGNDIKDLAQNLNNIVRVVENARLHYQQHAIRSSQFRGFAFQKDWDLSTLYEIVGRFRMTLEGCEKLLIQNREVYRNQNSIYNNEWTLVIQPKVTELQKRVRAHNSKISTLLKPLEIKLLSEIRHELGTQTAQDGFGQALPSLPIQGLLVLDIEQAIAEQGQYRPMPLTIPQEIESKVRTTAEQSRPELRIPGGLPLQTGVEALLNYFEQSTKGFTAGSFLNERTPSPSQYINLLNCLMILRHLQESDELKQADQNSLWPVYISELAEILRLECQRFTASSPQRLIAPDLASLKSQLSQGEYSYGRWKKEEISNLMSPHFNTYMEEVFKVPLPSPQESLLRELTISRLDSTKLRLVESVTSRENASTRLGELTLDIDVKTIQLTPIYAIPSSRPTPLEVLLHTGTSQLNPSFMEPKHVLRLQHLLTGYKVYDRYDQAMVKVSFFIAGQSTPLEEHGRVQLWLPQPFRPVNKASALTPPSSAANETPTHNGTSTHNGASAHNRAPSHETGSSPKQATSPVSSNHRSGSIRKWIPGLRRNSKLSNQSSNRSGSISGSSTYSNSPPNSPSAPNSRPNFPSIMEEIRIGYAAPMSPQAGPFELPADGPMAASPGMGYSGLHPISPNKTSAPLANGYPLYESQNMPAQAIGATGLGYNGISPSSPNASSPFGPSTTSPHAANGYASFNFNLPNGLQPPPAIGTGNPSPISSNIALPQSSSHHPNYSSSSFPNQGFNAPPSNRPPPAPSSHYNPISHSPSSRKTASVMSSMSTRSISSLAPTVSTIKTSAGSSSMHSGIARLHHKPQKPLLVIFLKSREASAKLAIVAIQIDNHTSVKRDRCECFNSHSACRISCVERDKGGSLLAQRWDADAGLASWNLAKVGESQRKEGENLWPNLRRVSMKFEKMEDRYKFAGSPCACNVKTTHELSRCNLDSHNGLFGIVKQIGDQMLLNYHNERDHATTKTMVLGPLPEGEL